jgi:hypothetical protein
MADRYGVIIVSSNPLGRFDECIFDVAVKPGQCVTLKAAVEPVAGKFTYQLYNRAASGDRAAVAIVLENELMGKGCDVTWNAGEQGRIYFPAQGEFFQMLVKNIAGTGDAFAIGDPLMIEDGSGKLIDATGSDSEPFEVLETSAAITEDTLILCKYTGH